jgi:hypothetical protein
VASLQHLGHPSAANRMTMEDLRERYAEVFGEPAAS